MFKDAVTIFLQKAKSLEKENRKYKFVKKVTAATDGIMYIFYCWIFWLILGKTKVFHLSKLLKLLHNVKITRFFKKLSINVLFSLVDIYLQSLSMLKC